jgi:hypothetical protein
MNLKTILKHVYFIIILWIIPFLVNFIVEKLHGDKGDPMFFTIIFLLLFTNIGFVHIITKFKWWVKIIFSVIIVVVSIFLSSLLFRLNFFPGYDPYGIMTIVVGNGVFTVILWNIIFEITKRLESLFYK